MPATTKPCASGSVVPSKRWPVKGADQRREGHAREALEACRGAGDLPERLHRDRAEVGAGEADQAHVERDQGQENPLAAQGAGEARGQLGEAQHQEDQKRHMAHPPRAEALRRCGCSRKFATAIVPATRAKQ